MEKNIEQRVCLKFCVANGISCSDALKMLEKAYGDSVISRTRAFEWYRVYKIKVLLTVFFNIRGVVHSEFLPVGQTVNKQYYLGVMKRLRESICRKRPELWQNNS